MANFFKRLFGNDKPEKKEQQSKMMDEKGNKLKKLGELAGKMKEDFVNKAKQGDKGALSRAGEMTLLQHWAEKVRNCEHTFERKDGRDVCTKCGFEDPDSLSIEEKWAEAWL